MSYTIPSDMYRLETDYVGLINAGYSLDTPLSTTNLIVIGNANNVNQAGSAVVAMPPASITGVCASASPFLFLIITVKSTQATITHISNESKRLRAVVRPRHAIS